MNFQFLFVDLDMFNVYIVITVHWPIQTIGFFSSGGTAKWHKNDVTFSNVTLITVNINSNALNTVKYIKVVGNKNNKIVKAKVPRNN